MKTICDVCRRSWPLDRERPETILCEDCQAVIHEMEIVIDDDIRRRKSLKILGCALITVILGTQISPKNLGYFCLAAFLIASVILIVCWIYSRRQKSKMSLKPFEHMTILRRNGFGLLEPEIVRKEPLWPKIGAFVFFGVMSIFFIFLIVEISKRF